MEICQELKFAETDPDRGFASPEKFCFGPLWHMIPFSFSHDILIFFKS